MKIAIFGLPASGKGTQAQFIENQYNIPQLSTGDMLRRLAKEDKTDLGDRIRAVPTGHFADDELILAAIKKELELPLYKHGILFDGFPRTEQQAKKMIEMDIIPDAVVFIKADEQALRERAVNRRIHQPSGRIYNLISNPPKADGLDDITKEPLTHRDDDKPEYLDKRFNDFNQKTMPAYSLLKALCKYGSGPVLVEVNGMQERNKVSHDLLIGINSAKAILKIRQNHEFVMIQSPYDGRDLKEQETYTRAAMHQSLMQGEIPFASHLLYSQPNVLDYNNEKHRELSREINKHLINHFDKVVIYTTDNLIDKENAIERRMNGKYYFLDHDTNEALNYAVKIKKPVEIRNLDSLEIHKRATDEPSVNLDIGSQSDIDSLIHKIKHNPQLVIVESPYAGTPEEIKRNEYYARSAIKDCLNQGEIPFASHLLYTQTGILDDKQSAQRRLGIEAGLIMGTLCQKSALYKDLGMTIGMEEGIDRAELAGRSVEIREIPDFKDAYEAGLSQGHTRKLKP